MPAPHDSLTDAHVRLFLCGDVMTGRGIDQILPHPCEPTLYEPHIKDARDYWHLAERANGPIQRPVDERYIWGDALTVWERWKPDLRIVNLETAVTSSEDAWSGKGIHYRMSPENAGCLTAAGVDCCTLANNHVLDWGRAGLTETLQTLRRVQIKTSGAGENAAEAEAPAVLEARGKHRVLVFSFGIETSGIPFTWAADAEQSGVNWLPDVSEPSIDRVAEVVGRYRRSGDIVVVSLHWGGNWGYAIQPGERHFTQQMIERAGADVVHGHSSHHPKGLEVYRDRLIIHGCGDFLTDYEGISGYERFRGDLSLMYFVDLEPPGCPVRLQMVPLQMHRLRLRRASAADAAWLADLLNREGRALGTSVSRGEDDVLMLGWKK
jgi:poly-gamma-glutamate synthesis protein (capsule biosynthesis protein)